MKRFLPVLVAILVIASAAIIPVTKSQTVEAAGTSQTGMISSTAYANVYKGPGSSYGTTGGRVNKGEIVSTYQTVNGWTYIQSNDDFGWIWNTFVQPSTGAGVFTNAANLYNGAGKAYGTSGLFEKGTTVVTFETTNGWTHIYAEGVEGWVWGSFVGSSTGLGTISISTVNVYNGAGKAYGSSGSLSKGTTVHVAELTNGWRHIYADGQEGWVWDSFITKGSFPAFYEGVITSPTYANVYNSAGKSNGTKGQLNNGEVVTVIQTLGGWTYVQSEELEGWIWGTYATPSYSTGTIVNTDWANIYNGPGSSYGKSGQVAFRGVTVAIYEKQSGWQHIKSGDVDGFVWGGFVGAEMALAPNSKGSGTLTSPVNVYRGPGTKYSTITSILEGAEVNCFQLQNGWRYIQTGNVQGWVWDQFVKSNIDDNLGSVTVFLDPGHGGTDPGASANGMQEKNITLDIGLKARNYFEKTPIRIMMTRDANSSKVTANGSTITTGESLGLRTDFAKENKQSDNDVFVSLHINAGGGTGAESYVYGLSSNMTKYDADSRLLATSIQKRMVAFMNYKDRGVDEANFAVLRENNMPATLVEMGFIDTASDAAKLASDYYKQQAAKAVYYGILDYYGEKGFYVTPYY